MSASIEPKSAPDSSTPMESISFVILSVESSKTGKSPVIISSAGFGCLVAVSGGVVLENFQNINATTAKIMTTTTIRDFFMLFYQLFIFTHRPTRYDAARLILRRIVNARHF